MEFLTLHELSLQFDVSVRVLRHRVRQLLAEGKLIENRDCRRDDYVDSTHFVWRINPVAFVNATGLRPVTHSVNHQPSAATRSVDQQAPTVTAPANAPDQTLPKVDTNRSNMEREMIDLLKDQVRVKDSQIVELSTQTKTLTALNEKLTGVVVHQSEEIRNLLRLTGGKSELSELVTRSVSEMGNSANQSDSKSADADSKFDNRPINGDHGQGSARAA